MGSSIISMTQIIGSINRLPCPKLQALSLPLNKDSKLLLIQQKTISVLKFQTLSGTIRNKPNTYSLF